MGRGPANQEEIEAERHGRARKKVCSRDKHRVRRPNKMTHKDLLFPFGTVDEGVSGPHRVDNGRRQVLQRRWHEGQRNDQACILANMVSGSALTAAGLVREPAGRKINGDKANSDDKLHR